MLVGPPAGEDQEWAEVGRRVGEAVAGGATDTGVLFCWTGTGASIAANKVAGVRAALCTDAETAAGARRWNDANVLVMSLRLTSPQLAHEMLDAWFATEPTRPKRRTSRASSSSRTPSSPTPRQDASVPTYVMLSTLGPDGWETLRQKPDRIHAVREEVEALGLVVKAQYALMGQYDFLNIIEAPDEKAMAKAAIMLAARGTMRTTTLQAIDVDELIATLKS